MQHCQPVEVFFLFTTLSLVPKVNHYADFYDNHFLLFKLMEAKLLKPKIPYMDFFPIILLLFILYTLTVGNFICMLLIGFFKIFVF